MTAVDHTPNAWTFDKTKFKMNEQFPIKVAKGHWAAATDGTLDAGNGDTLDIVTVPANCIILSVTLDVTTAETANGTVNIGATGTYITDDLDLWYDGGSLATAVSVPNNGIGGTLFTGDGTVDIRVTATTDGADVDIDGAVFDVYVVYIDVSHFAGLPKSGM